MFEKDKGRFERFVNLILLLGLVGSIGTALVYTINTLLPAGGDYSGFNLVNFLDTLTTCIFSILLELGLLLLINKYTRLFKPEYPLSKKILNLYVLSYISYIITTIYSFINAMIFNKSLDSYNLFNTLSYIGTVAVLYFLTNCIDILISSNTKIKNFINFIIISGISYLFFKFTNIIITFDTQTSIIDLIRNILLNICELLLLGGTLYYINFKNYKK